MDDWQVWLSKKRSQSFRGQILQKNHVFMEAHASGMMRPVKFVDIHW
jgi:hypothetical protein